jgi:hypothetical protein
MAVASGGTREIIEATLLAINLLDLFEAVVTIEDVQGRGKPARICFWKRLGVYACLPMSVRSLRTAMKASKPRAALG